MSIDPVLLEISEGIATLTLNRPENRNSMTPEVLDRFRERVNAVRGDSSVRAVIVTGTGASFCAGADFRSTPAVAGGGGDALPAERSFATY